jgi:NAD(P)-dependent dehydrogenase (short-subunit alcohol dehydrogenase family)
MRRILVTGANKGIGLAIARAILDEHEDTFVLLGARDAARGQEALDGLCATHVRWRDRTQLLELDVTSEGSVARAVESVAQKFGPKGVLYAVVNNAGVSSSDLATTVDVNVLGVRRVSEAFLALLDHDGGRIVNITSAAGPNFVHNCSQERQRFFLDQNITWSALRSFLDDCLALNGEAAFAAKGLGDGNAYGLSKACANSLTMLLAREHAVLRVNACTPGFIETDLTRNYATSQGKAPAELGMKPPAAGARAPMFLLFGDLSGNGRYYGSDAQRSPLDRYRAPGDPPYTGE